MLKNYINKFKNINPIYLIDFSISEDYVFSELEKKSETEIKNNLHYLMKTALYFKYKKLYSFLKEKALGFYKKTGDETFLLIIEKNEKLKKYTL